MVIYLPQSQADNDRQPDGIILEKPSNEAQQVTKSKSHAINGDLTGT